MRQSLKKAETALAERDEKEAELRESEERFRIISSVTSDYTFASQFDKNGKLKHLLLTGAFEQITGYTVNEYMAIGGWRNRVHPDDLEQDDRDIAILRQNKPIVSEIRTLKKNDEICYVRAYAHPVWDEEQNQLIGINGAVKDISEEKRLENELKAYNLRLESLVEERTTELQQTKDRLELVLNHTTNALAFADIEGNILIANPAFRAIFTEKDIQSIEFILWSISDEKQIEAVSDALVTAIYDREHKHVEAQIQSEGDTKDIDLMLIPVTISEDVKNEKNGILVSGHDITRMKEIERFKARFVADAVHDLATPISGISTRLYMLKRSPENINEHVRALENQVQHLRNLLEDLRTLSRVDRNQLKLNLTKCDLNDLLQPVFDTYEPVALEKQQKLSLHADRSLPDLDIDEAQIKRVLVNLVSNAINYTGEGKAIRIETLQENDFTVVRVIDEGMGISEEDIIHIFDRFYRSDVARSQLAGGTGLGLAISKEIVELHGGTIKVSSDIGKGSVFSIHLPLSRESSE